MPKICNKNPAFRRVVCPGQDLNLHELPRYHLKVVRLPIPPPGRRRGIICNYAFPYNAPPFTGSNTLTQTQHVTLKELAADIGATLDGGPDAETTAVSGC